MTPTQISMPSGRLHRIGRVAQDCLFGVGNLALLEGSLLAVLSSRECPGRVLTETVERVPDWVRGGLVIASGFHSPLEQQVLHSVLRRSGRIVKVLARSFGPRGYHPDAIERDALASGRMAVLSAFGTEVPRTTRASALERNRLVLALCTEMVVPHVAPGSPLAALVAGYHESVRQRDEH
jgi:predicted Rossmann fold nucleotide-binding protein DprA/Smf involved in DNA uptake